MPTTPSDTELSKYKQLMKSIDGQLTLYCQQEEKKSRSRNRGSELEPERLLLISQSVALCNLSTTLKNTGFPVEGEAGLRKALSIFIRLEAQEQEATTRNNLAVLLEKNEQWQEAFEHYQKALAIYERGQPGKHLSDKGNANNGLAGVLSRTQRYKEAIIHYRIALKIRQMLPQEPSHKLTKTHLGLGVALLKTGELMEAETHLQIAHERLIAESAPISDPTRMYIVHISLGEVFCGRAGVFLFEDSLPQPSESVKPEGLDMREACAFKNLTAGSTTLTGSKIKNLEIAYTHFQNALAFQERLFGKESKELIRVLMMLRLTATASRRYAEAERHGMCFLRIAKQIERPASMLVVMGLIGMANIFEETDRYAEAQTNYEEALRITEFGPDGSKTGILDDLQTNILAGLALVFKRTSRYKDAQVLVHRVLQASEKKYGPQSVVVAEVLNNLASIFLELDRYQDMQACGERALEIYEGALMMNSSEAAMVLNNLACCFDKIEHYEKSAKYHQRALKTFQSVYGLESKETVCSMGNLALIFKKMGRIETAKKYFQQAIAIRNKLYGENGGSETIDTLTNYADLLTELAEFNAAIPYYRQALNILTKQNLYTSKGSAKALDGLTYVFFRTGALQKALAVCNEALAIKRRIYKPSSSEVGETLRNLARLTGDSLTMILNYKKAIENYETSQLGDSYTACSIKLELAQLFVRQGRETTDIERREESYRAALELYGKLIRINHDLLQQAGHAFSAEDLSGHLALLRGLADLYHLQGQSIKAGELFENEANLWLTSFPRVSLYCIDQALNHYELCSETQQKRAQLLRLKVRLYDDFPVYLKPWRLVIRCLEKVAYLTPTEENHRVWVEYQQAYILFAQHIDEDLLFQLERSANIYAELENVYLVEEENTLSGYAQNKTVELLISQRNILDQAYSRLVTHLVGEPVGDLYYPVRSSKEELLEIWEKQGLHANKNWQDSYIAILKEQPFAYFDEAENEKQPELWKRSWLEKLTTINNDSKHVRLTPQEKKIDLQKQKGTLRQAQRKIQIQYLEKRFYAWSFVELLSPSQECFADTTRLYLHNLGDAKRLKFSQEIRRVLTNSGHIVNQASAHARALDYQKAKNERKDFEVLASIQQDYLNTVRKALGSLAADYEATVLDDVAEAVCEFMLRRASHRGNITELEADSTLDLRHFLRQTLQGVHHLVSTFGQQIAACDKAQQQMLTSSLPATLDTHRALNDKAECDRPENIATLSKAIAAIENKPFTLLTWDEIKRYHATLTQLSIGFARQGHFEKSGQVYVVASHKMAEIFPLMAIRYTEKASVAYRRSDLVVEVKTLVALSLAYKKQGLTNKAINCLANTTKTNRDSTLLKQYSTLLEEYSCSSILVDADIHSQLEYTRESFQTLRCDWFEHCALCPESSLAQLSIQHHVFELIIKIRHLLDQAFRRVLKVTVLDPNEADLKTELLYNYPSDCPSEKQLMKRLKTCLAIENPPGRQNLDPAIYEILKSTQPFAYTDAAEDWLTAMVKLSNKAKHERQPKLLSLLQAKESAFPAQEIEGLLQVEGNRQIIPLLDKALSETTRIVLIFFKIIRAYENAHKPYTMSGEDTLPTYDEGSKNRIAETYLIRQLNAIPGLSFFGVSDADYRVDAVMEIKSEEAYRCAKSLQNDLSGYGKFFRAANKCLFVLDGINLSGINLTAEGQNPKVLESYLKAIV